MVEKINGIKTVKNVHLFTEEEKNLIIQYCNERIDELNTVEIINRDFLYIKQKEILKNVIKNNLSIKVIILEDLYDMVWNRENLDKRHNKLNLSILNKIENTDYWKLKVKNFDKSYIYQYEKRQDRYSLLKKVKKETNY